MTTGPEAAVRPAPGDDAEPLRLTLALDDVPERVGVPVSLGGRSILLWRFGERVYATMARCTHQGAPLVEGVLDGSLIECPWHGARFDVRTGARVNPPKCRDLRCYRTTVQGGTVTVEAEPLSPRRRSPERAP